MKKLTKSFLSAAAAMGLLGVTTGTSNSASLNVNTGKVPEVITDTPSRIGACNRLPAELGACTTTKKDFTVEAVGNTAGTGAGGTTDGDTGRTAGIGAGEESRPSVNADDDIGSGAGDNN